MVGNSTQVEEFPVENWFRLRGGKMLSRLILLVVMIEVVVLRSFSINKNKTTSVHQRSMLSVHLKGRSGVPCEPWALVSEAFVCYPSLF